MATEQPVDGLCGARLRKGYCGRKPKKDRARCHQHPLEGDGLPLVPITPADVKATLEGELASLTVHHDDMTQAVGLIARRMDERSALLHEALELSNQWARTKVALGNTLNTLMSGAAWLLTYRPLALGLAVFLAGLGAQLTGGSIWELPIWEMFGISGIGP